MVDEALAKKCVPLLAQVRAGTSGWWLTRLYRVLRAHLQLEGLGRCTFPAFIQGRTALTEPLTAWLPTGVAAV